MRRRSIGAGRSRYFHRTLDRLSGTGLRSHRRVPKRDAADVAKSVDATDLRKLGARSETVGVEPLKFGES